MGRSVRSGLALVFVGSVGVFGVSSVLGTSIVGCGAPGGATEARPLTRPFDDYRRGAIEVDPKNLKDAERSTAQFTSYLEAKLRENGGLQPARVEEGAEIIIRTRVAVVGADDEAKVVVDFVDVKTRETVGQLAMTVGDFYARTDFGMRRVAESVAYYIRANRKTPLPRSARGPAELDPAASLAAAPPSTLAPGELKSGACTIRCTTDSTSDLPDPDRQRVVESVKAMLDQTRACLDRVSAQAIEPSAILRFEGNGALTSLKIDAGGYDSLACIQEARGRIAPVAVTRPATVRCEHRCR